MPQDGESDIIEVLYDAALGQRPWKDVGTSLVAYMGSKTTMLAVRSPRAGTVDLIETQGMTVQSIQEYAEYFGQHDLWALGAEEKGLFGRIATSSELVDDRTFKKSIIYNDYLVPKVNVVHIAGAAFHMAGGSIGTFAVHRPADAADFNREEIARMQRLLSHVQRAMEVRQRLKAVEHERTAIHAVLDRLTLGVILMGATGRLLHANLAAEAILREADGLTRTVDGLRASLKDDDRRLQELIARQRLKPDGARSGGGHLAIRRPSGRRAYAVMLAPAAPSLSSGARDSPAVLIFISDPAARIASDLPVLTDLFGLPPAEGRVVLALVAGKQLPELATETGVSYNTLRTLLSRAMSRTETRSQAELVLLVARALGGVKTGP